MKKIILGMLVVALCASCAGKKQVAQATTNAFGIDLDMPGEVKYNKKQIYNNNYSNNNNIITIKNYI